VVCFESPGGVSHQSSSKSVWSVVITGNFASMIGTKLISGKKMRGAISDETMLACNSNHRIHLRQANRP
jgi:hypothetical protein